MADDTDDALDQRLRAAMKTLDGEAPSEYFEALPNQVLSRLEATSMQTEMTGTNAKDLDVMSAPPSDDSGLHDIRSLAENTKRRLSRKSTSQPINEDVLASSSGSFRGIALPEPAKMVSLPELASLPSKAEIKAKDKAAKAAKKAEPEAKVEAAAPEAATAEAASAPAAKKPVATPIAAPAFGARIAAQPKNHTRTIALVGAGLAAAAGLVLYVTTHSSSSQSDTTVASSAGAPPAKPAAVQAAAPVPPPAPAPPPPAAVDTPPVVATPVETTTPTPAPIAAAAAHGKHAAPTKTDAASGKGKPEDIKAAPAPADAPKTAAKPGSGDPSFDDLLKEAGVQDGAKKDSGPKLAKKSLTGDDITRGMGALASKAQACYKGTQGTAMVKLNVAPSGQVTKVSVGGAFAGKPEADCVAAVAKAASFPPWDGGPQTVNYSYLLSE